MKLSLVITLLLFWAAPAAALVLSEDTVWSGDMAFAEDVRVLPGVTLTVTPGTVLRFAEARLEVAGQLEARDAEFSGEQWKGLLLKGSDASTRLSNCLIRGADTGIFVQGGAPRFDHLVLSGNRVGIELRGKAAGQVSQCRFVDNQMIGLFIKDDSMTIVRDCQFENNGRYGAYIYRSRPQEFRGNAFAGNTVGLMIGYHGSDPVIENNRFAGNTVAVQVDRSARPVFRGNLVQDNRTGLYAYRRSDPLVTGNRFQGNDVGILVAYSSYPQIEGNDFDGNGMALRLEYQSSAWEAQRGAQVRSQEAADRSAFAGQGLRSVTENDRKPGRLNGVVLAAGNWWGEAGTLELVGLDAGANPSFIHDGRDQPTFVDGGEAYPLDTVTFAPWSAVPLTGDRR